MSSEGGKKIPESRVVSVRRTQGELGVQICGGNLCGIFVENLEEDSPAKLADVLMPGDMILEVSCLWFYGQQLKTKQTKKKFPFPGCFVVLLFQCQRKSMLNNRKAWIFCSFLLILNISNLSEERHL